MKSNRITQLFCCFVFALTFGCGDISAGDEAESSDYHVDDGTFCRSGDLAACALERQCVAGDAQACQRAGKLLPSQSPGDMEPESWFTNADPEEPLPDLDGEVLPGGELGQSKQAFLSTQWFGWRVDAGGNPGFQDIVGGLGFAPRNRCGTVALNTCLFPFGPDLKPSWTWRFERGFSGQPGVNCGALNGNDDFLIGLRHAFTQWSVGTGYLFTEVSAGEDITLYCDGNGLVASRLDPKKNMHAAAYPFGQVAGPQADIIHSEFGQCDGDPSHPAKQLSPGPAYLYKGAGIVISQQNIFSATAPGWGACPGFNTNPNALINIGEAVGFHEMMHVLGFGHFLNSAPWTARHPSCDEVVNAASGPKSVPQALKSTLINFVSQRRKESINFTAGVGFQIDRQLSCLEPDLTNGSGIQLEGN